MGDRGRLVVPLAIREAAGFTEGTKLIAMSTPSGVVLMTRDQLKERVRSELGEADLVTELLSERRAAARVEDAV